MQKFNLKELIEYGDKAVRPKILINEPGYRMVLLGLRAGQSMPEHSNPGTVTVHSILGHITFYVKSNPCELRPGEVLSVEAGAPHRLEAHEDSALLVLATGAANVSHKNLEELDLREVPRPGRHPLVFAKLDALTVGDAFILINDHDPVPLSRQIQDLRPGQVTWEYNQRGPSLFRICIRRVAPRTASDIPVRPPSAVVGINRT
ncbi:MAG: DUF2249 domain-containing protein [Candidatus Acidiferrales bacterium]